MSMENNLSKTLLDYGLIKENTDILNKVDEIHKNKMSKEILEICKYNVNTELVIEMLYESCKLIKSEQERLLKEIYKALKVYRYYLINYDLNLLIQEIITGLDLGLDIDKLVIKLKTPKNNGYALKVQSDYYRIRHEKGNILIVNERNNRLTHRAKVIGIKNNKMYICNENDTNLDLILS